MVPAVLINLGRTVVGKVALAEGGLMAGNGVLGAVDEDYENSGTTNVVSDALNGILDVSDDISKGIEGAADGAKDAMSGWVPPFSAIGCGAVDFLESQRKMLSGVVGDLGGTFVNEGQKLITHKDNERVLANKKAAAESGNYLDAIAANGVIGTAFDGIGDVFGDADQNKLNRLVEVGSLSVEDSFGYSEAAKQYMSEEAFAARVDEGVVWQKFKMENGLEGASDEDLLEYHDVFASEWSGMTDEERAQALAVSRESLAAAPQSGEGVSFMDKMLQSDTVQSVAASLGISSETLDKVGDFVDSGLNQVKSCMQESIPVVEVEAPDETVASSSDYSLEM